MANLSSQTPYPVYTPGGFSTPQNTVAGNVSPSKAHGADFFPVASGIQVPYVGRDETGLRTGDYNTPSLTSDDFPLRLAYRHSVSTGYAPSFSTQFLDKKNQSFGPKEESLGRIAQIFSQTVSSDNTDKSSKNVSKSYLKKITSGLNFSDDVVDSWAPYAKPYNESDPVRVYNTTGISHRKTKSIGLVGRHDPPGSVRKHGPCYLKGPRKLKPLKRSSSAQDKTLNESSFNKLRISEETQYTNKPASRVVSQHEWDEHVLASISKSTAEWIIREHLAGSEKERLNNFLKKRYTSSGRTIRKDSPQDKTRDKTIIPDSSSSTNLKDKEKTFGRQPIEAHYSPSFTFSKKVGDKKLDTDNFYQQELLGGAQPFPGKKSEPNIIVLDSNDKLKFQKQLQENYPQEPNVWFTKKGKESKDGREHCKLVKGMSRWSQLPVVVQDDDCIQQQRQSEVDIAALSEEYKLKKKIKEDFNIVKIADEWRSKWFLENKWQKSTTDELIQAMNNINDHVRLAAVSACSKAAEIRRAKKDVQQLGIVLEKPKEEELNLSSQLEPELIEAVRRLLDDSNAQVRIASAITLYTLKQTDEKAKGVLEWTMEHGGAPEKWAATQCLALSGIISDKIIVELVHHLHADNAVRSEQACTLLAQLSQHTGIVQAMVSELLNSSSWKDRSKGCQVIPKLKCGTNRDMTQKLSHLMWHDWNKDVRMAAAQALGKTGNGKVVHDALRDRIMTGNERDQVDALKKLSNLGIMTARILPALLACFNSGYVSVRIEAAMAAGFLQVSDEKVIGALLSLAGADPSWKVKAHAIKALACVGIVSEKLHEVLLWAIRYEKVAAVRAEACNAVAALGITDERLLSVLQDRIVVETDDFVKREAIWALERLGVEPTGDVEMLQAIRREVRARCTRDAIVAHILHDDRQTAYRKDYKKYLTTDDEEARTVTAPSLRQDKTLTSRAVSEASSRGWDPILAGYQAREIMSRAPTPGELRMERSMLPMDLNSASSENSSALGSDDWDNLSDSEKNKSAYAKSEITENENCKRAGSSKTSDVGENVSQELRSPRQDPRNPPQHDGEGLVQQANLSRPQSEKPGSAGSQIESDKDSFITDHESSKEDPELLALADEEAVPEISVFAPSSPDDGDKGAGHSVSSNSEHK